MRKCGNLFGNIGKKQRWSARWGSGPRMRASQSLLGWIQIFAFAVVPSVSVAQTNTVPSPLDSFKKLEGTWSIQTGGKTLDIQMTYQLASKDSIVTEHFGRELSVFAMDGSALTMTHYCNVGNQPRLRLKPQIAKNIYEFDLLEVISPKNAPADHVERVIYEFRDDKRIDLKIIWWHPSGEETEHYLLERL